VSRDLWQPKQAAATQSYPFNFISDLAVGETITGATVTALVWSGNDPTPSNLISGAATISGTVVSQKLTGGVAGNIYAVTCTATTSAGQTLIHSAYLVVGPSVLP
jgi:hypothetical protein